MQHKVIGTRGVRYQMFRPHKSQLVTYPVVKNDSILGHIADTLLKALEI